MKKARPSTALIGIAGVHFVASELSRRGLVALPTTRNTSAYDIIAVTLDGRKHVNIQVKSSSKKAAFFRMPPSRKIRTGKQDVYVFVRWLPKIGRYEAFLMTGRQAQTEVRRGERWMRGRIRKGTRTAIVPHVYVGATPTSEARRWHRAWLRWGLASER